MLFRRLQKKDTQNKYYIYVKSHNNNAQIQVNFFEHQAKNSAE